MKKRIAILIALASLFTLASAYAQTPRCFLYVTRIITYYADVAGANLSAYAMDPNTGALTPVSGSPFNAGRRPTGIAADPLGRFVYVAENVVGVVGGMEVFAFTIDTGSGALTAVRESPYAGPSPFNVAVDPTGKYLYVANSGVRDAPGSVSAYVINPNSGALTEVSSSPFAAGSGSSAIAADPKGRYLYVANGRSSNVSAYRISLDTGTLTELRGSPFAAGTSPTGIAVDPAGKFLYVADNGSADIAAFAIDSSTGALLAAPGSPFAGPSPFRLAVDPKGEFLYATNNLDDSVSVYGINARSGALRAISGSPFATGSIPKELALDPTGKFLCVTNNGSGKLSVYRIRSSSGALVPVDGSPFDVGMNPYCVVFVGVSAP